MKVKSPDPTKVRINPNYYQSAFTDVNGFQYEAADVAEAFFAMDPFLHTAFVYMARAGRKEDSEYEKDIQKAIWWLERAIKAQRGQKMVDENGTVIGDRNTLYIGG